MAHLSQPMLVAAWTDLNQRIGKVNIPLALWRSPQNPAKPFLDEYERWDAALSDSDGRMRALSVADLEKWSASLAQQQVTVAKLEAQYGLSGESKTISVQKPAEETVTAALPWWYWPLRVGAGVSAGYFAFRLLKPRHQQLLSAPRAQPAFAGLGAATNAEGLTWSEFRRAAGRNKLTDPQEKTELRKAWKNGEDPSEWRKHYADKDYEAYSRG